MKHLVLVIAIILVAFCFGGCKKKDAILFCEGIDPVSGAGVKCGKIATPGNLTAVYKIKKGIEAKELTFVVYEVSNQKRQKIDTVKAPVKQKTETTNADLMLYNPGDYEVEVLLDTTVIAIDSLQIRDE